MAKKKLKPFDGLGPLEIKKIRQSIRQVWHRSYARKLVVKRCVGEDGFFRCEKCKKKTPQIKIDHIKQVGDVDSGFIKRLFCPSDKLQGLCPGCHNIKTRLEKATQKKCLPHKKDQSLPEVDPNQLPLPLLSRAGIK